MIEDIAKLFYCVHPLWLPVAKVTIYEREAAQLVSVSKELGVARTRMVVYRDTTLPIKQLQLVDLILASELVQAQELKLMLRFQSKLPGPEDKAVHFLVANPASLLLII